MQNYDAIKTKQSWLAIIIISALWYFACTIAHTTRIVYNIITSEIIRLQFLYMHCRSGNNVIIGVCTTSLKDICPERFALWPCLYFCSLCPQATFPLLAFFFLLPSSPLPPPPLLPSSPLFPPNAEVVKCSA